MGFFGDEHSIRWGVGCPVMFGGFFVGILRGGHSGLRILSGILCEVHWVWNVRSQSQSTLTHKTCMRKFSLDFVSCCECPNLPLRCILEAVSCGFPSPPPQYVDLCSPPKPLLCIFAWRLAQLASLARALPPSLTLLVWGFGHKAERFMRYVLRGFQDV